MQVFFLALGATRRRAVIEESARVVADGGRAVVVIDEAKMWGRDVLPEGVDVVEVSKLEQRHLPRMLETLFLYKGPRFLLYRVLGRGRLRPPARRAAKRYEQRFADRVHRRLFMPGYRRLWGHVRPQMIERHVLRDASFDVFVVSDPVSMPVAVQLLDRAAGDVSAARVAYSVDHVLV